VDADPFYTFPFYTFDVDADPFYTFPFYTFPFYTFDVDADPFYTFPFYTFPFYTFDVDADPFYTFPFYTFPFYTFPFYTFDVDADPFYTFPFYTFPFYTFPFYTFDVDADPFYTFPFYTFPFYTFYETWDDVQIDFDLIDFDHLDKKSSDILEKIQDLVDGRHSRGKLKRLNREVSKLFNYWTKMIKNYVINFWKNFDPEVTWNVDRLFDGAYTGDEFASESVQVAILDSGIDSDHPDLVDNIAWTYDATGSGSTEDDTGHGTHVAGIIAAANNDQGVTGVYSDAEIYAIKTISSETMEGEWEWLEEAIYAAVRGPDGQAGTEDDADVINMSFGSRDEVPPSYIHDAIKYAYDLGIVLVAAAGNDGDGDPSTGEVNWPAMYDEVIAVGALSPDNSITEFSNSGDFVEVVAPGDMILSTFLDGSYAQWGGTSMAAPHVSGLAALLIAQYGKLPVGSFNDFGTSSIRGLLHSYAVDLGTSGWDASYGYGLVQNP
jgi:subtilisin family serine protease